MKNLKIYFSYIFYLKLFLESICKFLLDHDETFCIRVRKTQHGLFELVYTMPRDCLSCQCILCVRCTIHSTRDNHACRWLISLKGRKRYWILFWAWKVNVFDFRGVTDVRQWWKRFVSLSRSFHPCFTSDNLNFFYFKKKEWNRSIVTDHIKVG